MKIFIGADHRGYHLKEKIKPWLTHWGYKFEDLGALTLDPKDDYTLYAESVATRIKKDSKARGILLCGSGVGVDIVANKFDGVRASIGVSSSQVKAGRNDDNMNILVLPANFTTESGAKEMVKVFLKTNFTDLTRFIRRLQAIKKIEETN